MKNLIAIASIIILAAAVGCANPAGDSPQAEVGEAKAPSDTPAGGTVFTIGEGSSVEWVGAKVTGTHEGGFNSFEGTIDVVDSDPLKSRVKVTIDTTSIWSDSDRLTGHLKSADFFEVETHPTATFESTSIVVDGSGYSVTGNLDLHGVTKSITFPASIAVGANEVMAKAEFAIKRFDFGIVYKGRADDLIHDDVLIRFALSAKPAG